MNYVIHDWSHRLAALYLEDKIEDAIKLILSQWNKDKKSLTRVIKCPKKAMEIINLANKIVPSSQDSLDYFYKLLDVYSKAIAYAPTNSSESSQAYATRSRVLCEAHMYEDSLKDIDRALDINCSDNLKAELYARKAKNLTALDAEPSAIEDAIAEACHWIFNTNADRKVVETILKELNEPRSYAKPLEKLDNSIIMSDITDANETFIGASNAIALKYSEKYGRHIVATRDINVGETLIKQKSYMSIFPLRTYTHCLNCSKRLWSGIPCTHCVNAVFCDDNCRNEAWNNFHDVECLIGDYLVAESYRNIELMGLRLVIYALKDAGSFALLQEKIKLLDSMPLDPLMKGFTGSILDGTKYASIYTLLCDISFKSTIELLATRLIICTFILLVWASISDIFGKKVNCMDELVNNESAMFMGRMLLKNMRICDLNAHQILKHPNDDLIDNGMVLSCLTGLINHSCDSNAFLIRSGDILGVNSIQTIKKGQQIFISYEFFYEMTALSRRQSYLKERYSFKCECLACESGWSFKSNAPSFVDQPLSDSVIDDLDSILTEFRNKFKAYSSTTLNDINIESITDTFNIPSLVQFLNNISKHAIYPCNEIVVYKTLLKTIYLDNSY